MSRRFSRIKQGAELNTALDNYITYLKNIDTRPSKRTQGGVRGSRRETVAAAVLPFGKEMGTGEYAATRVSTEGLTGLGTVLNGRLYTQGAQLAGAIKILKFRPAKVTAFRGTGAATYVQSKITKLYYLKYTGDTYGSLFGATSATEEEFAGERL